MIPVMAITAPASLPPRIVAAGNPGEGGSFASVFQRAADALGSVDAQARTIAVDSLHLQASGGLAPSELIALTTETMEFSFATQLTSNLANRTADGLQQLFRQGS